MATCLSDFFRVEIVFESSIGGIYQATNAQARIIDSVIGGFTGRGIEPSVIEPGGRGATGAGEALWKAAPWAIRIGNWIYRSFKRQREIELADSMRLSVRVHVQCFVAGDGLSIADQVLLEMLDVLRVAEEQIRGFFGPDFCVYGCISVYENKSRLNLRAISFDPGSLEGVSRLWFADRPKKFQTPVPLRLCRRTLMRTPLIRLDLDAARFFETPQVNLEDLKAEGTESF